MAKYLDFFISVFYIGVIRGLSHKCKGIWVPLVFWSSGATQQASGFMPGGEVGWSMSFLCSSDLLTLQVMHVGHTERKHSSNYCFDCKHAFCVAGGPSKWLLGCSWLSKRWRVWEDAQGKPGCGKEAGEEVSIACKCIASSWALYCVLTQPSCLLWQCREIA